MYTEQQLFSIARRENNTKRKYLVVNRLQGKHIPVSPGAALGMFRELAEIVEKEYKKERLLLIGFAETATAIGAELAVFLNSFYMQTTREDIAGVEYLYFSESHSHATEQKLIRNDLEQIIGQIDRIVFVEDEVTTGNTILKIIDIIEEEYVKKSGYSIRFSVASLLNGMNEDAVGIYEKRGIRLHYLVKTCHQTYTEIAEGYRGDGIYYRCQEKQEKTPPFISISISEGYLDGRRLNRGQDYFQACESLWRQICRKLSVERGENVLVVGTEEFMYPALFVAEKIEKLGSQVRCHSTTRSPIAVSSEKEYPLHARYELTSLYDFRRKTFLYDMASYDKVIIITDAEKPEEAGRDSLIHSIASQGNSEIYFIQWHESASSDETEQGKAVLI